MGSVVSKNQLSNINSMQSNKTVTSKIFKLSLHSKIVNLTSFNEELSSVDVVLLSRLMNNVVTYTTHNLTIYNVITMRWKDKKMIHASRCNLFLLDSSTTSNNERLRCLIDDKTSRDDTILYCYLL